MLVVDNNMTNSDWVRSLRWDLPFNTVEGFIKFHSLSENDMAAVFDALSKFIELPSYKAAPEEFKSEVRSYLGIMAKAVALGVVFKYSPNQERDEFGRWTSGGGNFAPLKVDATWQQNFSTAAGASARANMVDGQFTPERQALHRDIIRRAFEGIEKPEGQPTVYFLGGGAASGKSTAIEDGTLGVPTADSGLAVHIDPDALKEELPEYRDMARARDTGAAEYVHEESSYLANSIAAIAREEGYNVVLDGVNSGMKVANKIDDYRADGYKVEGHYITRPTIEAVQNNQGRFERAVAKLEAGDQTVFPRYVPADRVIAGHEEVSKNFEALAPLFDRATLTDMTGNVRTTVGETSRGENFVPQPEAAQLYQAFLEKKGS